MQNIKGHVNPVRHAMVGLIERKTWKDSHRPSCTVLAVFPITKGFLYQLFSKCYIIQTPGVVVKTAIYLTVCFHMTKLPCSYYVA